MSGSMVKAKYLVTFKTGKLDSNAAQEGGAYPFFTCSQETYQINNYAFDTECVLLAGNNATGVFPLKYFKGKFNAYQRTYIIEPINRNVLDIRYFYYYLRPLLSSFQQQATGATTKFLTLKILNNFDVLAPSLETQKKIAAILSAYDDLIENNKRRIALLEQMAEEIYREWFVRFRFPGYQTHPFEKGIPKGWKIVQFKDIVDRRNFGRIYREKDLSEKGKVIVIDQSRDDYLGFYDGEPEHRASIEQPMILFGDHSCKMLLMLRDFSLAENVIPFRPKGDMPVLFLFHLIKNRAKTTEYKRHWTGLTTQNVLIPSIQSQAQFSEQAVGLYEQIENMKTVVSNLIKTRDMLLPRLISGKLSVKDLDIQFPPCMINETEAV